MVVQALQAHGPAWYFGRQNLNSLLADFKREAAKRRAEADGFHNAVNEQLQSLSDGLGRLVRQMREVRDEIRELRGELHRGRPPPAMRESRGA